jgi:hypothetical protein
MPLHTCEHIIDQIKEAEIQISDPTTEDELDTSQSRSKIKRSPNQARKSLEYWKDQLYLGYPAKYKDCFGSQLLLVKSHSHCQSRY